MLVGAYLAIFQHDLKGLLAYSPIRPSRIDHAPIRVWNTPLAVVAGVVSHPHHATFKASLFMAAAS